MHAPVEVTKPTPNPEEIDVGDDDDMPSSSGQTSEATSPAAVVEAGGTAPIITAAYVACCYAVLKNLKLFGVFNVA